VKLWHVAQWGNEKTGVNGYDTQCIVSAIDLPSAVSRAEKHFAEEVSHPYKGGVSDVALLIGEDTKPDREAVLVFGAWIGIADNKMHYPAWYRHPETNEWLDQKTMYGVE
jgi:hypothetical protein